MLGIQFCFILKEKRMWILVETIGAYFRNQRMKKNISIRQLAKYTGVSPAYISQIENGYRKNPTQHVLKSLCDGLDIDYEQCLIETKQLTKTEIKERKKFYHQYIASTNNDESVNETAWSNHDKQYDLHVLLQENVDVYYKDRHLDDKDKEKINTMLHMLFE